MSKYQAYSEYKDSGVEWLGPVPFDWSVTKLKYTVAIFGRIGFRGYTVNDIVDEGEGALVLSPSNVINDQFSLEKRSYLSWKKYYESPEIMVAEGDILMVKTGSTFGKSTIVKSVDEPMTVNPQMSLMKASNIDPRYLSYLLNSSLIKAKIDISNTGSGMPTMTQENMNAFPVPRPSNDLAIKISNFLDHETAKIDTLIDKQQQLIQLLKEKRQAVISHAVTKGLNSNAPMRDPGVEWLGEVPEHWELWKLAHAYNEIGSGTTPPSGEDRWYEGDIAWITTGELRENIIFNTRKNVSSETIAAFPTLRKYPVGSVAIAMYGAKIGRLGIFGVEATTNQACCVFTTSDFISNQYLFYWLQAYKEEIINLSSGGGQPNINQEKVASLKVSAPNLEEQLEITTYLDNMSNKLETIEYSANKQIHLLQERRTALISAAVTGKIDVRNWESPGSAQNKEAV